MKKNLVLLSLFVLLFTVSMVFSMGAEAVKDLDIERYQGTWYEIGRYGLFFENGLQNVTAEYELMDDGRISVHNQGFYGGPDGLKSSINGTAYVPDASEPGKLLVRFFSAFESDYWVIDIDQENYAYAVVSTPSMNFLWILSRTPQMSDELYTTTIKKLDAWGFPVEKIQKVKQSW
ncbi:MAG TPA: lipocalin family protein [Thermotogota bacterium]|nr:lipocalin family protein [Thermotogota bacterium]HPJ88615.1 lipocalin family protein [Thermotogota bacterium]HPR97172.1 lipocalin family protein [Thermotogota bacterium]